MRKYGWLRGHHDARDRVFSARSRGVLPEEVDLGDEMPAVWDQGGQGSCTGHGTDAIAQHVAMLAGVMSADDDLSPAYTYWKARARRGWQNSDTGAYVRDALKSIAQDGVLTRSRFEYNDAVFDREPSNELEKEALALRIAPYAAVVQSPPSIMQALADGHPIVFGCTVYASFESERTARTGIVEMPGTDGADYPLGGHCMVMVGYYQPTMQVMVRNSWGDGWGNQGHCLMPFKYVCSKDLTSDLYVVTGVLT